MKKYSEIGSRKEIVEKFIKNFELKIEEERLRFKSIENQRIEAPGFLESASDTTRFQKEKEGEACLEQIARLKEVIDYFEGLKSEKETAKIKGGNICRLKNKSTGEIKSYFFVEKTGGIILDEIDIFLVSLDAPVANNFLGKKKGDNVVLKSEMEIIEIL